MSKCSTLKNCRKIGEGVYGEVFLNETATASYVLKIIPIEGHEEINGAQQKRFDEILQEVIISQELSSLRNDKENRTGGFVEVLSARVVEGRYPSHLIELWEDFSDCRGTENDSPEVFGDDQLYIVFELANCGLDLEAFVFKNADQSQSVFKQVSLQSFIFVPFHLHTLFTLRCIASSFITFFFSFWLVFLVVLFWLSWWMSADLVHISFEHCMTRFTLIHHVV